MLRRVLSIKPGGAFIVALYYCFLYPLFENHLHHVLLLISERKSANSIAQSPVTEFQHSTSAIWHPG